MSADALQRAVHLVRARCVSIHEWTCEGKLNRSVLKERSVRSRGDVAARYSRSVLSEGSAQARASERANLGGIAGSSCPMLWGGFFYFPEKPPWTKGETP